MWIWAEYIAHERLETTDSQPYSKQLKDQQIDNIMPPNPKKKKKVYEKLRDGQNSTHDHARFFLKRDQLSFQICRFQMLILVTPRGA